MNKQISKSILSLVLIFAVLLSLSISSYAENGDTKIKKHLSTIKINEYQKLKELKDQSDEELLRKGLSTSEIKEIKDFDYAKELKKRIKAKKEDLSSMGYSNEQINMMKEITENQELTVNQLTALSANCTLSVWEYGHFYNSSLSEVYLEADFEWSSIPVFVGTDILAIAWSDGMYPQVNTQTQFETHSQAYYYTVGGIGFIGSSTYTVIGNTNVGAYVKFPMNKAFTNSGFTVQGYCMNGYLQVYITKKAAVPEISVLSQYGHSTVTVSPTVQLKGSPSITFASTMTTEAEASTYIDLTIPR